MAKLKPYFDYDCTGEYCSPICVGVRDSDEGIIVLRCPNTPTKQMLINEYMAKKWREYEDVAY